MSFQTTVDAWVTDLTQNVTELAQAIVHRYSPWSLEELAASGDERHLAIWPDIEAETAEPLLTIPSHMLQQVYVISLWEDASDESVRRVDDEASNADWLELFEDIRVRIQRSANLQLGGTDVMKTDYIGGGFPRVSGKRVMELRLRVSRPVQYT
jgi:L-rhamnose mutarotase